MDNIKELFDNSKMISVEDLEKQYKFQLANTLSQITEGIRLAKQIKDKIDILSTDHALEREMSDRLEEALGTDKYIETFFTEYEVSRLIELKAEYEKIDKLHSDNGRYRITRTFHGPVTRKSLFSSYNKEYEYYKYRPRRFSLNAENIKKIVEGEYPQDIRKFALFNLDLGSEELYKIFNYKSWIYNKVFGTKEDE